jgi:hypothetical protein
VQSMFLDITLHAGHGRQPSPHTFPRGATFCGHKKCMDQCKGYMYPSRDVEDDTTYTPINIWFVLEHISNEHCGIITPLIMHHLSAALVLS